MHQGLAETEFNFLNSLNSWLRSEASQASEVVLEQLQVVTPTLTYLWRVEAELRSHSAERTDETAGPGQDQDPSKETIVVEVEAKVAGG